jgi:hypothetical protein
MFLWSKVRSPKTLNTEWDSCAHVSGIFLFHIGNSQKSLKLFGQSQTQLHFKASDVLNELPRLWTVITCPIFGHKHCDINLLLAVYNNGCETLIPAVFVSEHTTFQYYHTLITYILYLLWLFLFVFLYSRILSIDHNTGTPHSFIMPIHEPHTPPQRILNWSFYARLPVLC